VELEKVDAVIYQMNGTLYENVLTFFGLRFCDLLNYINGTEGPIISPFFGLQTAPGIIILNRPSPEKQGKLKGISRRPLNP
jgi:hypothetical protein